MKTIVIDSDKKVAILKLANGVTNAINSAMVEECNEVLDQIKHQYRAMVLTGGTKFFSIGLDLPSLVQFDRTEMIAFWQQFDRLVLKLYTLPVPTACVVSGHATAGGTILAAACDFRYTALGRRLMGLNEILIGLPVPYLADLILRQVVGDRVATKMTYTGEFVDPGQAKTMGLVDEMFAEAALEEKAIEKLAAIAEHNPEAFKIIKKTRVEDVAYRFKKNAESRMGQMLDCWFKPDVHTMLQQAAENF